MVETFAANPSEIAGLSNLVSLIAADAKSASDFVAKEGRAADWLHGPIIDTLVTPINAAAEWMSQRHSVLATTTQGTATELNKAAWMYHDQDQKTYAALNAHTESSIPGSDNVEEVGTTAQYVGAVSYAKPESFQLESPAANKEELAGLISEVFPVLGSVNESIKSITRAAGTEYDPLVKCLEPIPGNWSEIRRLGEVYKSAGNGLEICGKNLESGLRRIDGTGADNKPNWDGSAAVAFNGWATKQIAAMKWEGPVGRVVSDCAGEVADMIRDGIKFILEKMWGMLNKYVDFDDIKGALKSVANILSTAVPGLGAAKIAKLVYDIGVLVNAAIDVVGKIRELAEAFQKLLDIIKDPVGQLKDKAQQKLEDTIAPVTKKIDDATRVAAVGKDIEQIAHYGDMVNRPTQSYDVGTGASPWGNAS
ncbi:type VII secretion target [Nocardia sp. NPDC056064]|uniref:type VII secretion target n=1 Tax=Nocardia sp. NPDC056064 TaxID=3345701 RepID=UPI0035D8606D